MLHWSYRDYIIDVWHKSIPQPSPGTTIHSCHLPLLRTSWWTPDSHVKEKGNGCCASKPLLSLVDQLNLETMTNLDWLTNDTRLSQCQIPDLCGNSEWHISMRYVNLCSTKLHKTVSSHWAHWLNQPCFHVISMK